MRKTVFIELSLLLVLLCAPVSAFADQDKYYAEYLNARDACLAASGVGCAHTLVYSPSDPTAYCFTVDTIKPEWAHLDPYGTHTRKRCGPYSPDYYTTVVHFFHYSITPNCKLGQIEDPVTGECHKKKEDQKNAGDSGCSAGTNPINVLLGNKYQTENDYSGHGLFSLSVYRTFNALKRRWQFFPYLEPNQNLSEVTVVRPNGKEVFYEADGFGGWISEPDITDVLESILENSNIIGWKYTTLNQDVEEYDLSGRITSKTNKFDLSHNYTYTYDAISVTHSFGQILTFQIDVSGRVSGFTTHDSKQYLYNYDQAGRLLSIEYPENNGLRVYEYEDSENTLLLTGITDANGDRFATWTYDNLGRAISSSHHNGADLVTIDYTYLDNAIDPRATATNPLGKQTTYHFTTIHGVRKVTQVEGHPSTNCAAANKAYTYDANGFLETKTDWQGNITRYTRNAKGQELTRIEAEGTPVERTITTEWHSTFNVPTKITDPEQETTFNYDVNGNQLSRTVNNLMP